MCVYLEQRPGREPAWVAEVTVAGVRHRSRHETKREAQRWSNAVKDGRMPESPTSISLGEAARCATRERSFTRDHSHSQRLEAVLDWFGPQTPLDQITAARLQGFVNHLRGGKDRPLTPATVNRYLSVVSGILDHARRTGRTQHTVLVPWQEEGRGKLEWLTREQEDALAQAMPTRHALILRVLCATGLRAGELWGLKPSQVEAKWLRLWETKSGKPRSVPIDPSLSRPLRTLIEAGSLPSYKEHYRVMKRCCMALGLSTDLSVHSYRHTTGTRLAAVTAGAVVQKFLGHADYRTTQRYVHLADDELQRAATQLKQQPHLVGRTA